MRHARRFPCSTHRVRYHSHTTAAIISVRQYSLCACFAAVPSPTSPTQYGSSIASLAVHRKSAFGAIMRLSSFSTPLLIFHVPTHLPRSVRAQYFSRSPLVANCSPLGCSKGVRPIRISKKVTPRDQTSDLRVSCGRPRARSGERYYMGA